jgi:hypothetical protein
MMTEALQKAIDALQIHDVYLRRSEAWFREGFDPKFIANPDGIGVQTMHVVKESSIIERDQSARFLQVFLVLGTRFVESQAEGDEPPVVAQIEAEFIAEYELRGELDQASIDEFALKNASYHVWPYWREYLASQCERMRLPRLIIPAVQFAENRHATTGILTLGDANSP